MRPNIDRIPSTVRTAELPCSYEGLLAIFAMSCWAILATLMLLTLVQP